MVVTAVRVENSTKELLNELKKSLNSKTYDEVIQNLVRAKTGSMYGKLSKGGNVSAARMMKGLRDKSDGL